MIGKSLVDSPTASRRIYVVNVKAVSTNGT